MLFIFMCLAQELWMLTLGDPLCQNLISLIIPIFGVSGFDYFRTGLWTKMIKKTTYIGQAQDFSLLCFLKNKNQHLHLFAFGTENADTIRIKLIPELTQIINYT